MSTEKKESVADIMEALPSDTPTGFPSGNYCIVGWDMDTTGRRILDEICQIAAYTPASQFSQYIMPNGDLIPAFRRRHNIRVVTVGRYRLLKSNTEKKVLKTKSEVSALTDFVVWLEGAKGEAIDGVILICHETRKTLPFLLIESLRRFNLLDRFNNTVKGFTNGFELAVAKCGSLMKSFGLQPVARILLGRSGSLESAVDRARLAFQVAQHLSEGEKKDLTGCSGDPGHGMEENMIEVLRAYTQPMAAEIKELDSLKQLIERQKSFRPIFGPMLTTNRFNRQHASILRKILAEGGVDYDSLNEAYDKSAKLGLEEQLEKLNIDKIEQHNDLLEILDTHFDPEKTAKFPNSTRPRNIPRGRRTKSKTDQDNSGEDREGSGASTPDTTTSSSLKEAASSSVTSSDATPRSEMQEEISSGESE